MEVIDSQNFSLSLLLGRKELLSEGIYFLFARLGLAHALCASGLHVQIMCNFAYVLMRLVQFVLCCVQPKLRWRIYSFPLEYAYFLLLLISYGTLCNWTIPITRAVLSYAFFLFLCHQSFHIHKAYIFIFIAVLSFVIGHGSYLSFLLSFSATLSFYFIQQSGQSFLKLLLLGLLLPCLATTPLVVYFFHLFSPISILANLLFFPLLQMDLFLSVLELSIGKIDSFSFISWTNTHFVDWQLGLLRVLASIPYGSLWCSPEKSFSLWCLYVVLYYCRIRWSLSTCWFLCLVLVTGLVFAKGMRLIDKNRAVVLDVAQGDSILLKASTKAPFLVDAGGPSKTPYASRAALALARNQVSRLTGVLLTHPDRDHQGGFSSVFLRHRISSGEVWLHMEHLFYTKIFSFLRAVERAGLKVRFLPPFQPTQVYSGLHCIMIPSLKKDSNDSSPLCKFHFSSKESLLLTGDMSTKKEREFVLWYPDFLSSSHLKLGHHGSKSSSHPLFLQKVRAKKAYVSAGAHNRYSHPHPEVLQRAQKHSMTLESTIEEGDIFLP